MARRRMGDRNDGRLIRSINPFSKFIPYIMPTRNDALIHYEESFEISKVDKMLRSARTEGYKGIGFLHFIIAAYVRSLSMLPGMNRFIAGRRIYARNNIEIVMTVKKAMTLNAEETTIKVEFEPTDTIYDVYRKMNEKIDEVRTMDSNGTDEFAEACSHFPRPILRLAIALLKLGDYFGWLPKSLLDVSPFHGSMIITDLGSLRIGPVYHHIYNFGTLPVFIAFGSKYHQYDVNKYGEVLDHKKIDCKFVMDERIADGHYFAQFLQAERYIFEHPEIVETPPSRVNDDID